MNLVLLDRGASHKETAPLDHVGSEDGPPLDASVPDGDNDSSLDFVLASADARAKHILRHLKKQQGDRVRIGLFPSGAMGEAVVASITSDAVSLRVDETTLQPPRRRPVVRILIGVPYPRVVKALWAVLSSFGVEEIIYAKAELTESDFLETSALTPKVYEPLLREGLSQGMDTRPPRVKVCAKYTSVLDLLQRDPTQMEQWTEACCKIVLHIADDQPSSMSLRQCYQTETANANGIFLAIGPERGWTDDEVNAFSKAGFCFASLGHPILRTDTAVVAAVALSRDVLLEAVTASAGNAHTGKRRRSNAE